MSDIAFQQMKALATQLTSEEKADFVEWLSGQSDESSEGSNMVDKREAARQKLLAAGRLSTVRYAPLEARRSSPEEDQRLSALFADDSQSLLDLVNEDRGDY